MIDISVTGLIKSFDLEKKILDGITFQIDTGERVGLLGKNGAGKTTLINLLMRFYEIDGGRITLDGVDTSRMDRGELRQQFGMVLQLSLIHI